jgi:DNA-directed RNA polymerase specialized sigma24 family protein
MGYIIIPSYYNEASDRSIVPICIHDTDPEGTRIDPEWFQRGVIPVADPLRRVAARVLNDIWRVSEITERAVHSLWRTHGPNLGDEPSLRVLKRAYWYAEDLRAGGRRARRMTEVELFAAKLETLQDQFDLAAHIEAKETLERLMDELERLGLHDVREMVPMMLRDCDASEFTARFGVSRNTLSQRFYRGMRKAAKMAGITW